MNFSENVTKKLNYMNIPVKHWNCVVSKINPTNKPELLDQWLEDPVNMSKSKGLFITGAYGRGKSGLAAILAIRLASYMVYSYWVNYRDLVDIRIHDKQLYDRILSVPVLIIDELHMKPPSKLNEDRGSYAIDLVDDIVRTRVQKNLCNIITSNQTPKTLSEGKVSEYAASFVEIMKEAVDPIIVRGKNKREDK